MAAASLRKALNLRYAEDIARFVSKRAALTASVTPKS